MNPLFVKKRPQWYCGEKLPRSLETGNCRELSGHVLDEIIDAKLTKTGKTCTIVRAGASSPRTTATAAAAAAAAAAAGLAKAGQAQACTNSFSNGSVLSWRRIAVER